MSIETEGAINNLTAATMALAVQVAEQKEELSPVQAREKVQREQEAMLNFLLDN